MARPHIVIVGAGFGDFQSGARLITGPGSR
jgi:NADH dehydrogenase FAD-containing subunit